MTVDDVDQRGNRSWGSVRVVDSWPSKRRSTLLCSYHAISCCPLESGPRASFLASFTVCKLYLPAISRRSLPARIAVLFSNFEIRTKRIYIYIFIYVKDVNIDSRSSTFSSNADWNCSIKWNSRNQFGKMTISTRSVGNARFRHNSDAPRKLQREHGASVCCAKIPSMGWILNSQRPRENRRSLDDCHVRHGSLVVLIDHLFPP